MLLGVLSVDIMTGSRQPDDRPIKRQLRDVPANGPYLEAQASWSSWTERNAKVTICNIS